VRQVGQSRWEALTRRRLHAATTHRRGRRHKAGAHPDPPADGAAADRLPDLHVVGLYTDIAFLVLPWVGLLLGSWLGVPLGIVLYVGSRLFSPQEERLLSETFGASWDEYRRRVKIAWL
jgi:hypothetical protein